MTTSHETNNRPTDVADTTIDWSVVAPMLIAILSNLLTTGAIWGARASEENTRQREILAELAKYMTLLNPVITVAGVSTAAFRSIRSGLSGQK